MTAPLRLTADDLERLTKFLRALSEASNTWGCWVDFNRGGVEVGQPAAASGEYTPTLRVVWDNVAHEYVVDDRSGD